jgi:hypothetical protein
MKIPCSSLWDFALFAVVKGKRTGLSRSNQAKGAPSRLGQHSGTNIYEHCIEKQGATGRDILLGGFRVRVMVK